MSGEELRKKIQEAGLTVTDVANKLGMSQANLSGGFKVADIKTGLLERICVACNLPMSFFYPDESKVSVNAPQKAKNLNNGSGTINDDSDAMRLLLKQNQQLLDMLASQIEVAKTIK